MPRWHIVTRPTKPADFLFLVVYLKIGFSIDIHFERGLIMKEGNGILFLKQPKNSRNFLKNSKDLKKTLRVLEAMCLRLPPKYLAKKALI